MPKLYFRHGCVGSAKTLNLLAVAHAYKSQGKCVKIMKPEIDTRFGSQCVKSRAGLSADADILLADAKDFDVQCVKDADCVLVDECQFLSSEMIDKLREMVDLLHVPVICYGLRTDFMRRLFPGSQRLFELSDNIEEIKHTCYHCVSKAIFNLAIDANGQGIFEGPTQIRLGCEESYLPVCGQHYK